MTILVIEDDELIGQALGRFLRSHAVTLVTNGRDALEVVRCGERYDAIICDVVMPGLSGIAFHSALAHLSSEQADRVIFMSAIAEDAHDLLAATCCPCLAKPLDLDRLRLLLEKLSQRER